MPTNNFETTDELLDLLKHLTGDRTTTAFTNDILMGYLNQAHRDIINGGGLLNTTGMGTQRQDARPFGWLTPTEEIVELLPYTTGNITITNGSASATLDSSPAASKAGWFLEFDNSVYKISAHTGATATVTLDSNCASATGTYAYTLYKLDYTLSTSDILRLYDEPYRMSPSPMQIDVVSFDTLSDVDQFRLPAKRLVERVGINYSTSGVATLRVATISDRTQRLKFKFVVAPTELDGASNDPILPKRHRKVIAHYAAFMHLEKRDDSRAQAQLAIARQLFGALCADEDRQLRQQGKEFFARARLARTITRNGGSFLRRRK